MIIITKFKQLQLLFYLFVILTSCQQEVRRPNVLFIAVDDLRPELGCYGKEYIHSPNIDKLASEGMVFNNHYVQVPTCGASRYNMLTGMLPSSPKYLRNRVMSQVISNEEETERPESFIHHLKRNGYYTVGIGKISHYPDGLIYDWYADSISNKPELPYSWNENLFNHAHWGTAWKAFFGFSNGENAPGREMQVRPYEKGKVDDKGYVDGYTAELGMKKLEELANKNGPFFLGVGFFKPHLPFNAPEKYWNLYNEDKIPLSETPFLPKNIHKESLYESNEINNMYKLGEEKFSLEKPVSDAYARKLKHAYFACVSYVDAQIGKVLNRLEALGLDENTIVILWGDHGWQLGDHLMWGKHTIFEKSLRSAFIIRDPYSSKKGVKLNEIVSTVDIYPTIMELCDIEMPHQTDGTSLVPLLKNGSVKNWRNHSYSYFKQGISLRTNRFRLTKYFREEMPNIELYDYHTDPFETENIANQNPDIVDELMPILEKGDTGLFK